MRLWIFLYVFAKSCWAVEYTDCFSAEGWDSPPNECPSYDIKQSDSVKPFGDVDNLFIVIAPSSTLTWSGSAWLGPNYGKNKTVWHLNCSQANDLYKIELLEIEQLDHQIVCKKMMFNRTIWDTKQCLVPFNHVLRFE